MFYESPKYKDKRIIYAGVAALVILFLIFVGISVWQKKKQALPFGVRPEMKTAEEKRQEMLDAIKKANKDAPVLSPKEQAAKKKDMEAAIKKANEGQTPVSDSESSKKVQDMLNAINKANNK